MNRDQVHRSSLQDYGSCPDILPVKNCYQFENRWYQPYSPRRTWYGAARVCKRENGHLTSLRSREHSAFLASISTPSGSWIGARASSKPGHANGVLSTNLTGFVFNWEDNHSLDSSTSETAFWARGSPSAWKPKGTV